MPAIFNIHKYKWDSEIRIVRENILLIGAAMTIVFLSALAGAYLFQMNKRGGFEALPETTPLPSLRITQEKNVLQPQGDLFSFSVFGDIRWEAAPRIAILKDGQMRKPLFMVNLGDVVEFGRKIADTNNWRFIFLDTSKTYLPMSQRRWLRYRLEECKQEGKRAVIFTHCPPRAAEQGITHSLTQGSTDALARIIAGYDVAAIFAAHIHKTFSYVWNGIPVYIAALNDTTWTDNNPAEYLFVTLKDGKLKVKTIKLEKH